MKEYYQLEYYEDFRTFDGNDVVILKRGTDIVDSIRKIDEYVGSGWVGDNE
ncbi:MAG: hypothetical protein P1P77_00270 [Spirochaetaceae bacterium]|nr:hypothetical protein [Spirochaetaceae bacterium]